MSEKNKATLKEANTAVDAGNYEGFLSFCTEDTDWTFVGDITLKGKEAVRQWMVATYREPPKNTVTHLIAEGDFLTVTGDIITKDANGKEIHSSYCDVWRFSGGKLAELKAYVVETEAK